MRIYLKLLITTFFIVPLVCNSQDWSETKSIWINPSLVVFSQEDPDYKNYNEQVVFNPFFIGLSDFTDRTKAVYYKRSLGYRVESHLFTRTLSTLVPLGPHGSPPHRTSVKEIDYRVNSSIISWANQCGIKLNKKGNLRWELGAAVELGFFNNVYIRQESRSVFINGEPGGTYSDYGNEDVLASGFTFSPNIRFISELAYAFKNDEAPESFQLSFTTNYKVENFKRFKTLHDNSVSKNAKNWLSLGLKTTFFFTRTK